jgi:predicted RNA-binding protein YlqC (UPF0109 family)
MPDPRDVQVYELLLRIVCAVVDHPGEVRITFGCLDDGAVFTVRSHPNDTGKMIGAKGSTAKAIRTVIRNMEMKHQRTYTVLLDESRY